MFDLADRIDEEAVVSEALLGVATVHDVHVSRELEEDVSAGRCPDEPGDAVADAAVVRVDEQRTAFARLLVRLPAVRVDAGREEVVGGEEEVVVVLRPRHVTHLKVQLHHRCRALDVHRRCLRPAVFIIKRRYVNFNSIDCFFFFFFFFFLMVFFCKLIRNRPTRMD